MVSNGKSPTAQVFGEMTWLIYQSPVDKHLAIADPEWTVMPPFLLNQFHIFYNDNKPLAFATWAFLYEEFEQTLLASIAAGKIFKMDLKSWKSGDRLWLVNLVCPTATGENGLEEQLIVELGKSALRWRPFRLVGSGANDNAKSFEKMRSETVKNA